MRTAIRLSALILFAVVTAWAIYYFYSTGSLKVSSDSASSITVQKKWGEKVLIKGKGNIDARLKPGNYTVISRRGDDASIAVIKVEKQATASLDLPMSKSGRLTNLASLPASNIHLLGDDIYYLDYESRVMKSFNRLNYQSQVVKDSPSDITDLTWNGDTGIISLAQGEIQHSLFVNGSISRLKQEISTNSGEYMPISVDGSNIAYADGKKINFGSGPYLPIYTAPLAGMDLLLKQDYLLISYSPPSKSEVLQKLPASVVLNIKSGVSRNLELPITNASWSPRAKYLAYINDSEGQVVTNTGVVKETLPARISSLLWLDEETLVYSIDDEVWSLNIANRYAQKIGSGGGGVIITSSSNGPNGELLFSTTKSKNGALMKLINKSPDGAESVLPYTNTHYSIEYSSGSEPTLIITTYAPITSGSQVAQFNIITKQYQQEASDYLRSKKLDPSKYQIIYRY